MELQLGFRITVVLVVLALTLSSKRVEAQRAGKTIKHEKPVLELICVHVPKSYCIYLFQGVKMSTMTWHLFWTHHPV